MRGYWRRKENGEVSRGTSFMDGVGPASEYRDRWEEVQVVPVDAVVVELPEVALEGESWVIQGRSQRRGFSFGGQDDAGIDESEQFALDHLAAVRAERARRAAEKAAVKAAEERLAAANREAREGAERILAQLGTDTITRHLAARKVLERALRDGVIEEKGA